MSKFALLIFVVADPPIGAVAIFVGFSVFLLAPQGLIAIQFLLHPTVLALTYQVGGVPAGLTGAFLVGLHRHGVPVGYEVAGIVGTSVTFCIHACAIYTKDWLPFSTVRTVFGPIYSDTAQWFGEAAILACAGGVAAVVCFHLTKPLAPSASAR